MQSCAEERNKKTTSPCASLHTGSRGNSWIACSPRGTSASVFLDVFESRMVPPTNSFTAHRRLYTVMSIQFAVRFGPGVILKARKHDEPELISDVLTSRVPAFCRIVFLCLSSSCWPFRLLMSRCVQSHPRNATLGIGAWSSQCTHGAQNAGIRR